MISTCVASATPGGRLARMSSSPCRCSTTLLFWIPASPWPMPLVLMPAPCITPSSPEIRFGSTAQGRPQERPWLYAGICPRCKSARPGFSTLLDSMTKPCAWSKRQSNASVTARAPIICFSVVFSLRDAVRKLSIYRNPLSRLAARTTMFMFQS